MKILLAEHFGSRLIDREDHPILLKLKNGTGIGHLNGTSSNQANNT